MTVYMFPGQGSQFKGMGENVFSLFPDYLEQANDILQYDVKELCLVDPRLELDQTKYTQPALYVVSALMYLKTLETKTVPNYLIGHSLGEYTACFAAGCFDFATGLQVVQKRAELMSSIENGAMLAVSDLTIDEVDKFLREHDLTTIDIANHNTATRIVISGPQKEIEKANAIFSEELIGCVSVKVSGAFHSRYMEPVKKEFANFLKYREFFPTKIPVIANINAQPYQGLDVKDNLINQVTGTVRWYDSVLYLLDIGETRFEQIGPGTILTGLVQKIKRQKENAYG